LHHCQVPSNEEAIDNTWKTFFLIFGESTKMLESAKMLIIDNLAKHCFSTNVHPSFESQTTFQLDIHARHSKLATSFIFYIEMGKKSMKKDFLFGKKKRFILKWHPSEKTIGYGKEKSSCLAPQL